MQSGLQLSLAQAGALGSANTAGYLVGALVSHRVLGALGYRRGFYAALLIQAVTLLIMGLNPPLAMMFFVRALQGVLGALVFVGGASLLLASGGRAGALGFFFGGVGAGIVVSTLIAPLADGWQAGWVVLGVMSLVMGALSLIPVRRLREPAPLAMGTGGSLKPVALALLVYGVYGAGYIGYMTFVTSGIDVNIALFWLVLGAGTLLNGPFWGLVVGRWGGVAGIRLSMLMLVVASIDPVLLWAPYVSAVLFGLSFLGVVTAVTDLIRKRLPPGAWPRAMAMATAAFALGQAVGPGLTGVMGDLAGGVHGSLWAATALLAVGFAVSLFGIGPAQKSGRADT